MRKRSRFLLSIFMLFGCIATLVFGVLSATTVNYQLGGTVNYTVKSVFCKVETTINRAADYDTGNSEIPVAADLSDITWNAVTPATSLTYDTANSANYEGTRQGAIDCPFNITENSVEKVASLYKITVKVTLYAQSGKVCVQFDSSTTSAVNFSLILQNSEDFEMTTSGFTEGTGANAGVFTTTAANVAANTYIQADFYLMLNNVTLDASGSYTLGVVVDRPATV